MLAVGAIAERGRLGPALLFIFIWSTIVYDPIACWTWNQNGWSDKLGVLDFAGGTPVHISSGTAALAISIYLGKRRGYGTERLAYKPHNTTYVILGTVFLWFGWFGFNGGKINYDPPFVAKISIIHDRLCFISESSSRSGLYRHKSGR